jgi:hypothetical protein
MPARAMQAPHVRARPLTRARHLQEESSVVDTLRQAEEARRVQERQLDELSAQAQDLQEKNAWLAEAFRAERAAAAARAEEAARLRDQLQEQQRLLEAREAQVQELAEESGRREREARARPAAWAQGGVLRRSLVPVRAGTVEFSVAGEKGGGGCSLHTRGRAAQTQRADARRGRRLGRRSVRRGRCRRCRRAQRRRNTGRASAARRSRARGTRRRRRRRAPRRPRRWLSASASAQRRARRGSAP